jgi:hypothetical protein
VFLAQSPALRGFFLRGKLHLVLDKLAGIRTFDSDTVVCTAKESPMSAYRGLLTRRSCARQAVFAISLVLFTFMATGHAAEWKYWIGIHDFVVGDVNSHTYGIGAGMYTDERTESGTHLFGNFDVCWDHDQDHLDSDHIPIWWRLYAGSDGELWKLSSAAHVDWTADISTRINTVSSIERQIEVLPALAARFDGDTLQASLKAGVGYLFLEIDDDAPKERGYGRETLRNTTFAGSLAADGSVRLGQSVRLVGRAQTWWDGDEWLHTQYAGELHVSADRWIEHSEIIVDAEVNEYNLDPYNVPGAVPVLPWDDDLMIRVFFVKPW